MRPRAGIYQIPNIIRTIFTKTTTAPYPLAPHRAPFPPGTVYSASRFSTIGFEIRAASFR